MTRDCGHSTGDDQRLWTFGEGGGATGYPLRMHEKHCAL
ncbi:unnamed protein product [Staurois parvus]|uniref:Uncharacterized protein n=1 Tax=Staurois parvus TaxID=386267 RepID=A0ABN9ERZ6_9NEOB|nr:unnamed protein product [Staurois parvus]